MKPLAHYEKIKGLAGWFLRNRRFQAGRPHLRGIDYLHAGCGPQVVPGFINLDYRWTSGIDIVWDLSRPLPFPDNRFKGIFTEHCLEHFDLPDLQAVLSELLRVLQPGGVLRIVVPCLETHARLYLAGRSETDDVPAARINQVFYAGHAHRRRSGWTHDGHHFMHDHASLAACLRSAGFAVVRRTGFGQGSDTQLLIDRPDRAWESLYVEAAKQPGPAVVAPA